MKRFRTVLIWISVATLSAGIAHTSTATDESSAPTEPTEDAVVPESVQSSEKYTATAPIEEIVVEGQILDIDAMNEFEVKHYYNANARGGQLYKMRRYDEAKPYLAVGAKLGFKMSQARLGAIYAYGLGSTERDAVKGITWIGVAAEHRTDPALSKQYRTLLRQIPASEIPKIEALVAEERAMYGSSATGTKCQMIRSVGTHMATLSCEVKDVYKFRSAADRYDMCLMMGLEGIVSDGDMASIPAVPCM